MSGLSSNSGIRWRTPPSELARSLEQYGDKVLTAVGAVAQYIATQMQDSAKANAPWEDRTGNARSGLFGTSEVDYANKIVTIYLSHSASLDYGIWLELCGENGLGAGKYAIVMQTMQAHYEPLMALLREVFA